MNGQTIPITHSRLYFKKRFALIILCSAFLLAKVSTADDYQEVAVPYGIWQWHDKGEQPSLSVAINYEAGKWTATVDNVDIAVTNHNDNLAFSLADGQSFKGKLRDDGLIQGSWIQAESKYYYSKMATFVTFVPSNSNSNSNKWKTIVARQPRPFHIFLDLFEDEHGNPVGALRNPERNETLGITRFNVVLEKINEGKHHWKLSGKRGKRDIVVPFIFSGENTIEMKHPFLGNDILLVPASGDVLKKYYSRMPATGVHGLSKIEDKDDGWEIAQLIDFNVSILENLVNKLATADPRSTRPSMLHSVLVSYKGKLVLEEYFFGHSAKDVHDTRSLAKVFGSVMVGTAQQNGHEILPSYTPLQNIIQNNKSYFQGSTAKKKSSITLEHFLTYTSGLDTSEDDTSFGSENRLWEQRDKDFWLYTAKLPILHPPGKRYAYSSASANMVGAAITQVTNQSIREHFHLTIAEPLQFAPYHWNLTPNDKPYLGGGVYMRPRDLLKIGAVYAAKGKWKNQTIVPSSWVDLSTSPKIAISPQTTGMSEEEFNNNYSLAQQAFIWQVYDINSNGNTYKSYQASGNGGQLIIVVPELELAVSFTGGNYRMFNIWGKWREQIVGEHIIAALQKQTD